jgi:hypothetical protein
MIDVEANGRHYQEMNVDAGVVAQTFLYPVDFGIRADIRTGRFARERHAYLLRNGRLDPDWASVNRDFLTITERAIDTMIHYPVTMTFCGSMTPRSATASTTTWLSSRPTSSKPSASLLILNI